MLLHKMGVGSIDSNFSFVYKYLRKVIFGAILKTTQYFVSIKERAKAGYNLLNQAIGEFLNLYRIHKVDF